MGGKSVSLCLFVFGLSLAAASPRVSISVSSDEDSGEEWQFLPVKRAITTTEPPRSKAKATTTTTTTTTTERTASYEYYEDAAGSLKLHPAAPWREARRVCHGEGAELASPETAGLHTAMSTALLSSPQQAPEQVYTGINDLYSKGLFSLLRGTPLTDMAVRWAAGAPSNLTSRDNCLALRRDGLLRDTTCDAALPYFCYKKEAAGPETECGTNPEYKYNEDAKGCYKIHKSTAAWKEAYASCRREGAHLLVLGGWREALVVRGLAREAHVGLIHVGATRWEDGDWMTVHGETLQQAGFAKWSTEESGDSGACAALVCADAALARRACALQLPFICEKKPYL